jgi:hypothetical protein
MGRAADDLPGDGLASIQISEAEKALASTVLIDRLVERGFSRLTAERFVAIQRGSAEAGRARPHSMSRR